MDPGGIDSGLDLIYNFKTIFLSFMSLFFMCIKQNKWFLKKKLGWFFYHTFLIPGWVQIKWIWVDPDPQQCTQVWRKKTRGGKNYLWEVHLWSFSKREGKKRRKRGNRGDREEKRRKGRKKIHGSIFFQSSTCIFELKPETWNIYDLKPEKNVKN